VSGTQVLIAGEVSTGAQVAGLVAADDEGMTTTRLHSQTTTAFYVQSVISFAVSTGALLAGIAYSHMGTWVRAFLAVGLLYAVTSTFTLAKCIRDRQEASHMVNRVDEARLEKLLSEHDLYRVDRA
jgi:hypothetical protein